MEVLSGLNDSLELLSIVSASVPICVCLVRSAGFVTVHLAGGILLNCDKTNLFTFWSMMRSYEREREERVYWEREERL